MFRKIYVSTFALLITSASLLAQASGIKVHITDKASKAALPFVNVVVEQSERQVAGAMTDDKGYAELKPLEPGTYSIRVQSEGYRDYYVNGIEVTRDVLAHIEVPMVSVADTSIGTVVIVHYKKPLIMEGTQTGGVADSEDIHHMAANDIYSIAANVPGVYSSDVNSGNLNIRGGRGSMTLFIIDGQKVTEDQNAGAIPMSLMEQESVITGGTPAKYGDAAGGIVEITTLSGANNFFGNIQGITSELFDSYGYNQVVWGVGGPIWTKLDSNKYKHTIIDFIFGGDYTYQKDQSPTFIQPTYVNPSTLAQIQANPILPDPQGGFSSAANYITSNQTYTQSWHTNNDANTINLSGKVNFHINDNIKITAGGSYQYATALNQNYSLELFDPSASPQTIATVTRGYVNFTQKFYTPEGKDKNSLIKNAFYNIMAEYSNTHNVTETQGFGNNLFDYGYVGQFYQYLTPVYNYNPSGPAGPGNYMVGYGDSAFTFKPSNLNGVEANYTNDVIKYMGTSGSYSVVIPANVGYINGGVILPIYSLWATPGATNSGYSEYNANHFRFSANFSAEIANNSVEVGFEYEQNIISYYSINASYLWTLMRQLANEQLQNAGLNTSNPILVKSGTINTYNYNYSTADLAAEPQFDKSLREAIGASETQWLQPDEYTPAQYQSWGGLSMFSASNLLQNGSSIVNYYGYNYQGNLGSTTPSINDFFNQKDANGNLTYPEAPYQPIYMAGYIQDHFDIKSMRFDVGLRVEQFNANEYEIKDPYVFFGAKTVSELSSTPLASVQVPSNIGSNYVVYVNNIQSPTAVVGYRNGNNWYDANGNLVSDPTVIASASSTGTIQPYLENPSQSVVQASNFTTYTPQTEVLPRLAFSFPITDKANFFAHYDILSQRPTISYNTFQAINYLYIQSYSSQIPNPALNPQLVTDYELGFQQVLDEAKSMVVTISAFYRDQRDEVEAYRFLEAYPIGYVSYANVDFGTTKGLEIQYDLRRLGNWSDVKMMAAYNLQFSNGTGSGPNSGFNLASSGEPNILIPERLDYDQRHTITTNLDFHFSSGANYDGPVWTTHSGKVIQVLSNAGININFSAGSGTPYTQYTNPVQLGSGITTKYGVTGSINGDNLPWQNRVDLTIDKSGRIKIGSHPCQISVFIKTTNLLNTENVLGVFNFTGNPTDDGFLQSPAGKQVIAGQISPQAYVSQYQIYEKIPSNFTLPRLARLGVTLNF